jgi:hypothetical protein
MGETAKFPEERAFEFDNLVFIVFQRQEITLTGFLEFQDHIDSINDKIRVFSDDGVNKAQIKQFGDLRIGLVRGNAKLYIFLFE